MRKREREKERDRKREEEMELKTRGREVKTNGGRNERVDEKAAEEIGKREENIL